MPTLVTSIRHTDMSAHERLLENISGQIAEPGYQTCKFLNDRLEPLDMLPSAL